MVEFFEELSSRIDHQLLGYLNADDEREKLRSKLQMNMRKYLSYAPHTSKFHFPQTSEVLRRSITARAKFSAERASRAWAALAKYAENLIRQPWRKEFREIKLYCGFYKHEVEAGLVGAELMFEAMGYVHVNHSVMRLQEIFDGDQITCVSRDAMMAEVECQILQEIWEQVAHSGVTWSEILEGREDLILNPEKLVQTLKYQVRSRRYGETRHIQQRTSYPGPYEGHPIPQAHHHMMHQPMPYPQYSSVIPPNYHCSYNYQVLKPHDFYPSNGHLYMRPPPHNGYNCHYSSYPTTVPTGQLIELNTSPTHHHPPQYFPVEPIRTTEIPSSRAKDDGAGSWENWDNVYQKLENRDSDRQLNERVRAMSFNRATTPPPVTIRSEGRLRTDGDGASRHRLSKNSIELEDAFLPKARLTKNSSESEAEVNRTRVKRDYEKPSKPEPEQNHYKNDDQQRSTEKFVEASKEKFNVGKPEPKLAIRNIVTLDVSPKFKEETSKNVEQNSKDKWECCHCTFFNPSHVKICEMCNKSRNLDEVPPQPCGGSECPQCTLVNERGENFCSACNCCLKDSPTYI